MDVIASLLSTMMGPEQGSRLLQLHTPLGPDVLVPEACQGGEALSGCGVPAGFQFQITALSVEARLQAADLLGQPVLLTLLTADSRTQRRPFHGHVTQFEYLDSNGGLARYRLTMAPWVSFLEQRVDSHVYQDMTPMEALDTLFGRLASQGGSVVPRWRWDLEDPALYSRRSLATQLDEDGLGFMTRTLAEHGLFYWFEHEGESDDDGAVNGSHTLVIADHNAAFADLGNVRFHRSDATEKEDSVQQWCPRRAVHATRVRRSTWDYRALRKLSADQAGNAPAQWQAEDDDSPAAYAWHNQAEVEWRGRRHIEALEAAGKLVDGESTWRRLAPGGGFRLSQHQAYGDGAGFLCLAVLHQARNNLGPDMMAEAQQRLGDLPFSDPEVAFAAPPGSLLASVPLPQPRPGSVASDYYRNGFIALAAEVPYRPGDGHARHGQATVRVRGLQSAVVTTDATPVLTDRDHRIKVQYPWQRGANASSGEPHPDVEVDNAPASGGAWTWVRTLTPWAGEDWGGVAIPRAGQESLTLFLEGQPERPVAIGTVYNGQGNAEAQHNHVAGGNAKATANAAAWFTGNDHKAVFSGFKSQALASSQQGDGGFQWLFLDASNGQGRAEAGSTQHHSRLGLGHLKAGKDNLRQGERGFGADLNTAASGALRAGQGVLLSTEAGQWQMSGDGVQAQLQGNAELLKTLVTVARHQGAGLGEEADEVPAQQSLSTVLGTLANTQTGIGGDEGGDGTPPGWSRPMIVATSPDGVAGLTPKDHIWVAGTTATLVCAGDINWMSQTNTVMTVAKGLTLYNHGQDAPGGKPNQEKGINLHAAQGKVSARTPKQPLTLAAEQDLSLASTASQATLSAPNQPLLLASGGAYLKLDGGNIELGAPGGIHLKGASKEFAGPGSASAQAAPLSAGNLKACPEGDAQAAAGGAAFLMDSSSSGLTEFDEAFVLRSKKTGQPLANRAYRIICADGSVKEGVTDENGSTCTVVTSESEDLRIEVGGRQT